MTIKTQNGKVLTKDGKVSCECCGPCDGCSLAAPFSSLIISSFTLYGTADLHYSGGLIDSNFWSYDPNLTWTGGPELESSCEQLYYFQEETGIPSSVFIRLIRTKQEGKCGYKIELELLGSFFKFYIIDSCEYGLFGAMANGSKFVDDENIAGAHSFAVMPDNLLLLGFEEPGCPDEIPAFSLNGFTAEITITN